MQDEALLPTADSLDARQFLIAVRKLADSLSYGADKSPFLGSGIEFAQSRPYQDGDPIRSIDWRVTAKTGKIFVKEYESPKRLPCFLLVDTSASMIVSSTARSKYATALHLAGGLGLACLDRTSPVGILGVGEGERRTDPTLSKLELLQGLHRLRRFRFDERTRLGARAIELGATLPHRALVIVLSDLHDPAAPAALKRLAQRHDVACLQLRDPAERSLVGAGFLRATEAETGRTFVTHGRRRSLDQESLERDLRKAAIDLLTIDVDLPFVPRLRHFFKSRDLLGRGAR